ncbi:VOC family protein [Gluconobacter japonicus]|uniref:VOC family protein n=1 Tax=Gluconobacter japonicus TaxID=376620 RepID=UPI0024AD1A1A|nr:VOC family protein [Gluconobacter japonicus]MDI6652217.1 VOC family protein [Gluconobacter japonicus]
MHPDHSGLPRGIDHVGVTVPDINVAIIFLEAAFGAVALYRNVTSASPQQGSRTEAILGLPQGTVVWEMCMMSLGHGPGIELFEMHGPDQHTALRACDFGLQHFAVYVDDIHAACARFIKAGGELLTEPQGQPSLEAGPGNMFCYGRAPWGMIIELLSTPSRERFDDIAPTKRYQPPPRHEES